MFPGGSCPTVSIGGLTLDGGIGFLSRKYGLTCDLLCELEIVLADGSTVTASNNNEYNDLFWACKGAARLLYGGAMSRMRLCDTAFYHQQALFSGQFLVRWHRHEGEGPCTSWITNFYDEMRPYVGPYAYANYGDGDLDDYGVAY
ncbi:unnamed protein product [Didymodactylos carnosus]|uniref:FAD linked oxidase N-terminal domain-containing protein n=1 Tax=Didymodactylos carnosus TaxID=1234261 RepID=A0A815BUV0_9BILA|nr:unnamed protein product [Didymodactylos carnosus]CAF4068740.1 unnamed protein product [Didymodactylos carnosus]